jgi:hypothetical protein
MKLVSASLAATWTHLSASGRSVRMTAAVLPAATEGRAREDTQERLCLQRDRLTS